MPPTIIYKKASNWVDRGESPNGPVRRVLAHFFRRLDPESIPWLDEHGVIIIGMVEADATEVHIAGYLRSIVREEAQLAAETQNARQTAIALWHIAKAAHVRDFAERVLRGEIPVNEPTPDTFSHWVASKILSPEELAAFEKQAKSEESED